MREDVGIEVAAGAVVVVVVVAVVIEVDTAGAARPGAGVKNGFVRRPLWSYCDDAETTWRLCLHNGR